LALIIVGNIGAGVYAFFNEFMRKELLINYGLGLIFGAGLVISGMCRITKIMGFLTINANWDPSLIFVMMSAVAINVVTFNHILTKVPSPTMLPPNSKYSVPPRGVIDMRLLGGAAIFGLGWGISGLCPGPGVICFFILDKAFVWVICLAIGQVAFDMTLKRIEKNNPSVLQEPLIK
jgi:uncharacterized membrane protein YedE/YeeE